MAVDNVGNWQQDNARLDFAFRRASL